jgi:cobyrinic acid a,c-diamide synthase
MQDRLVALGYREVRAAGPNLLFAAGEAARGHEFHYSTMQYGEEPWPFAYETEGRRGVQKEGFARGNVLAGYTHLHFVFNPQIAVRFLEKCLDFRRQRGSMHGGAD